MVDREEILGRFANVDLGSNATLERMVKREKEKRDAIIEICAEEAEKFSITAAKAIRELKNT